MGSGSVAGKHHDLLIDLYTEVSIDLSLYTYRDIYFPYRPSRSDLDRTKEIDPPLLSTNLDPEPEQQDRSSPNFQISFDVWQTD